jgi:hypothetical protein
LKSPRLDAHVFYAPTLDRNPLSLSQECNKLVYRSDVQADRRGVVLDALAERVGEPREAPHRHSHRQVRALDVLPVGRAGDYVGV